MSIFSDCSAMSVKMETPSALISTKPSPIAIADSRPPLTMRSSPGFNAVSTGTWFG